MSADRETIQTLRGRLEVLRKALVNEQNSVDYHETLLRKAPGEKEEHIGAQRTYEDLQKEEREHVATIQSMIHKWETALKELETP